MDEITYLKGIEQDPDNVDLRSAYLNWLEQKGDRRAECLKLMNERSRLEREVQEINRQIQDIDWQIESHLPRGSQEWLDVVCPLSIRSPLVGRFYTAPRPDATPFVSVGDRVSPETVVGIVESMMLFNEVSAGIHGVITAVLIANQTAVEYNQLLFKLSRPPRPIAGG